MTTVNNWITKFDDRINPIVLKELRQAVNGRFVAAVLGMFLLISLIIVTVALMNIDQNNASQELGLDTLLGLNGILVATCVLFLPIYTAVRMAAERSDTNTDLLFISTLRPRQIISGKLLASAILGLLIYSACMPFMTLTYLLRGVDLPSIFIVLAMGYTVVIAAISLALFAACATVSRGFRVMLALSLMSSLGFAIFLTIAGSVGIIESGFASTIDQPLFWAISATWLGSVACTIALLVSFSVALISPPTSNRAMGVRITVLIVWLVNVIAYLAWCLDSGDEEWLYMLSVTGCMIACGMMLLAVNERDHWTNRLLRTIPRNFMSRILAMTFYSGALGGLLFSWIILLLTVAITVLMATMDSTHIGSTDFTDLMRVVIGSPLFIFSYVLSARLLRAHLLGRWVKQDQTWALAAVLAALCIGIPLIIQLLIAGPGNWYDNEYWTIFSPVGFGYNHGVADSAFMVAVTWAIIAVALNFTWFIKQLRDFRRPLEIAE